MMFQKTRLTIGCILLFSALFLLAGPLSGNVAAKATGASGSAAGLPPEDAGFLGQFGAVYTYGADDRRGLAPARLASLNGGAEAAWDDWAGSYVLVNFWAMWCAPCVKEMPALGRLAAARPGLRVVTVAMDTQTTPNKILKFLKKHEFPTGAHYMLDAGDKAGWVAFADFALPTSVILHPDGHILYKLVGPAEWDGAEGLAFIDRILAKD